MKVPRVTTYSLLLLVFHIRKHNKCWMSMDKPTLSSSQWFLQNKACRTWHHAILALQSASAWRISHSVEQHSLDNKLPKEKPSRPQHAPPSLPDSERITGDQLESLLFSTRNTANHYNYLLYDLKKKKSISLHAALPKLKTKATLKENIFCTFRKPDPSQDREGNTNIWEVADIWVKFSQMYHGQATKGTAHEYSTPKFQCSHTSQDYHTIIS